MPKQYSGGCQCGAVRYQAELDLDGAAGRCNCTMCTKLAATVVIVKPAAFEVLSGKEDLTDYTRNGGITHFPFCRTCGVRSFGTGDIPEVGGEYVSIYVNCLDGVDVDGDVASGKLKIAYMDGRHNNWDAGPRDTPYPIREPI